MKLTCPVRRDILRRRNSSRRHYRTTQKLYSEWRGRPKLLCRSRAPVAAESWTRGGVWPKTFATICTAHSFCAASTYPGPVLIGGRGTAQNTRRQTPSPIREYRPSDNGRRLYTDTYASGARQTPFGGHRQVADKVRHDVLTQDLNRV